MQKIKIVLVTVGAFLSVVFLTFVLFLLRRSNSNRRGINRDNERDSRIEKGFEESSDTIRRCEEHLQRAEGILREAINRSKK